MIIVLKQCMALFALMYKLICSKNAKKKFLFSEKMQGMPHNDCFYCLLLLIAFKYMSYDCLIFAYLNLEHILYKSGQLA